MRILATSPYRLVASLSRLDQEVQACRANSRFETADCSGRSGLLFIIAQRRSETELAAELSIENEYRFAGHKLSVWNIRDSTCAIGLRTTLELQR